MKNNKRYLYKQTNIYLKLILILVLVFFIGFFMGKLQLTSRANEKYTYSKTYYSIKIEYGDTLESIAKKYNNTELSTKEYIKVLKKINKISSDNIYAGTYLIIEKN